MGDVIAFNPKTKTAKPGHRFTLYIYQDAEGKFSAIITENGVLVGEQPDGDDIVDAMQNLDYAVTRQRFEETGNPRFDIVAMTRVYRSSWVYTEWHEDFDTPAERRWLKRRLADAYWQLSEKRGIGYRLHTFKNNVIRFINFTKDRLK